MPPDGVVRITVQRRTGTLNCTHCTPTRFAQNCSNWCVDSVKQILGVLLLKDCTRLGDDGGVRVASPLEIGAKDGVSGQVIAKVLPPESVLYDVYVCVYVCIRNEHT